jgi:hypothetical protein
MFFTVLSFLTFYYVIVQFLHLVIEYIPHPLTSSLDGKPMKNG